MLISARRAYLVRALASLKLPWFCCCTANGLCDEGRKTPYHRCRKHSVAGVHSTLDKH